MRLDGSVRSIEPPSDDASPLGSKPDERSIFDEAPARSVAFQPRTIRPPGRRGRLAVGAWILGLVTVAGLGLLDPPEELEISAVAGASMSPDVAAGRPYPTTLAGEPARGVVELRSPAPAGNDVLTRRVTVEGRLLVRASELKIALEARGNRVLDQVLVDVSDPDGGIRPKQAPRFSASFELPFPRPNDPMWVVVTAYDEHELPLGATRRQFTIGPLLESPPPLADSQPLSEAWRPAPVRGVSPATLSSPTCPPPFGTAPASSC